MLLLYMNKYFYSFCCTIKVEVKGNIFLCVICNKRYGISLATFPESSIEKKVGQKKIAGKAIIEKNHDRYVAVSC